MKETLVHNFLRMSPRLAVAAWTAASTMLLAVQAHAQTGVPPIKLQRVEPTTEDIDPLRTSLRDMQIDLRQPSGFQNIYRVPNDPKNFMRVAGGLYAIFPQSVYSQGSNGLVAEVPPGTVFHIGLPLPPPLKPQPMPEPLPSTLHSSDEIFSSQKPPSSLAPLFRAAPFSSRIDSRVATLIAEEPQDLTAPPANSSATAGANESENDNDVTTSASSPSATAASQAPEQPGQSIITDPIYRAQRLTNLLRAAAQACQGKIG